MWPVIQRELRAEARSRNGRRLRFASAALALLALFFYCFLTLSTGAELGRRVFAGLHGMMFKIIWAFVPLMTADCISREIREGTLGLLFLTPLRAHGIMFGKACVQALRALTVWWAGLPILAVPLVMGGVTLADFLAGAIIQVGSIAMALAVGLLASSYCRRREAAMVAAAIGALACLGYMGHLVGSQQSKILPPGYRPGNVTIALNGVQTLSGGWMNGPTRMGSTMYVTVMNGGRRMVVPVSAFVPAGSALPVGMRGPNSWLWQVGRLAIASQVLLLLVYLLAASRLNHAWRDRVRSAQEEALRRFWLTPAVALEWFRHRQNQLLDGNPIRWLQQYSVNDRVLKWGLCFAVILWETLLIGEYGDYSRGADFRDNQFWLGMLMMAMLAFSAAGSFRRERENGALELILVTPIRENQLLFGRLSGIWWQFLPALAPLLLVWVFWWEHGLEYNIIALVVDLIALPLIGFYFSLRLWNFFMAWMLTLAIRLFLTYVPSYIYFRSVVAVGGAFGPHDATAMAGFCFFLELCCGGLAGLFLWNNLTERRFLVHRPAD